MLALFWVASVWAYNAVFVAIHGGSAGAVAEGGVCLPATAPSADQSFVWDVALLKGGVWLG